MTEEQLSYFSLLFPNLNTQKLCFAEDCGKDASGKAILRELRFKADIGHYVRVNPFKADADTTGAAGLAEYRNFLVELDVGTLNDQVAFFEEQLRMPWSASVYSGGKSIHFIVSLATPLERDDWLFASSWLKRIIASEATKFKIEGEASTLREDATNFQPVAYTRVPGLLRTSTGKDQVLMELRERVTEEAFSTWLTNFRHCRPYVKTAQRLVAPKKITCAEERESPSEHVLQFLEDPQGYINKRYGGGRQPAFRAAITDLASKGFSPDEVTELLAPVELLLGVDHENRVGRFVKWAVENGLFLRL